MIKAASIFSLFCGIAMLSTWAFLLAAGHFPELQSSPMEAAFLLAAEFLTAVSLLAGGFGLLAKKPWGLRMDLAALGMLLYCTIFSTGALGAGSTPAAVFFSILAALAALFTATFILKSAKGEVR